MKVASFFVPLLLAALPGFAAADDATAWKPVEGALRTRWTSQVDPSQPHPEYPRPQMVRPSWINLNGLWDYAIRGVDDDRPAEFDGKILVPFPVESSLSGVKRTVRPEQRLWYRRTISLSKPARDVRFLLHFGAVDWHATVHVNGARVGEHKGGYDPFSFDVTEFLDLDRPTQEIVVSVWDPTNAASQPRGKQVLKPGGIMYTAVTGIWQTVWLEPVPTRYIESVKIVPDLDAGEVRVAPRLSPSSPDARVVATVLVGGKPVAETSGPAGSPLTIKIPDAKPWTPDLPFLYDLNVAIEGDSVRSYFGLRKIAVAKDEAGVNRLFLNGKPLFQAGPLDQGWWPDGLYTAPTDEALKYDLEVTKQFGFNMVRKHVKVEPATWYAHCDRMGLMVWQDMPSGDNKDAPSKVQFAAEWERIIDALHHHPSIVMWVPFNEGWGQHDTAKVVAWTKAHDPSRLVNNASGWFDAGVGDVNDMHNYPGPGTPPVEPARAAVLGEFGGLGLPLSGHVWVDDKKNWGYRTFPNQDELTKAYLDLTHRLRPLAALGLSASVYTQTTDVEVEVNGLMTYDRAVIKIPPESASAVQKAVYGPLPSATVLAETSLTTPQTWRFTTEPVADDWLRPEFDDSRWSTGPGGFGTKGMFGAPVHTEWKTPSIHLRRAFSFDAAEVESLLLAIRHDEDAEVFLNGALVSSAAGHVGAYQFVPLDKKAVEALKPGRNVLAVSCKQTTGEQFIDVGLFAVHSASHALTNPAKP